MNAIRSIRRELVIPVQQKIEECFSWDEVEKAPWKYEGKIQWVKVDNGVLSSVPLEYAALWCKKFDMKLFVDIDLWGLPERVLELAHNDADFGVSLLSLSAMNSKETIAEARTLLPIYVERVINDSTLRTWQLDDGTAFRSFPRRLEDLAV